MTRRLSLPAALWARLLILGVATVAALLLLLALFPWGWVAGRAAGPIGRAIGRPVTIGSARRVDLLSLVPTIELRDVQVAQPAWAEPGTMARVASARIRLPVLPLLLGKVRPREIALSGVRLELRRTAEGKANWEGERNGKTGGGDPPDLSRLTLHDVRAHVVDAKRALDLTADLRSDAAGFAVKGDGRFHGAPIALTVTGTPLTGGSARDWPARVTVVSPLVRVDGRLVMRQALALDHFTARIRVSGRDLAYFDDLVEGGLFPTKAFRLSGAIRRDEDRWRIERLEGRIGATNLIASATVAKVGERTRLDGRIDAATLDFGDFQSEAQAAQGEAKARAIGPRVVPATRIELDGVRRLDGVLELDARRLVGDPGSPLLALKARVALDDRRLEVAPLVARLRSGTARGRLAVDDRGPAPRLTADLTIGGGARIETLLLGDTAVVGPLAARVRVSGTGKTVRDAVAAATGKVGLAVRGGTMRRDYATFLGGDLLKSVGMAISGGKERVPVRCLVANFRVAGGRLTPAPLVLDATIARGDGGGAIRLPNEQIDLAISGRAARPGLIQSSTPVRVLGSLSDPKLDVRPPRAPARGKSGLLDRVGALVKGLKTRADAPEPAAPAPCDRLVRQALG